MPVEYQPTALPVCRKVTGALVKYSQARASGPGKSGPLVRAQQRKSQYQQALVLNGLSRRRASKHPRGSDDGLKRTITFNLRV